MSTLCPQSFSDCNVKINSEIMRQYSEVLNASNFNTHSDSGNGRKQPFCLRLFLASTSQENLIYTRGNLFPSWFISSYLFFLNKVPQPPTPLTSTSLDALLVVCPCDKVNWAKPRGGEVFQMSFGRKENNPQKERQHYSFRNSMLWQKGRHEKEQFCDSERMQKSEFLPTQKDRGIRLLVLCLHKELLVSPCLGRQAMDISPIFLTKFIQWSFFLFVVAIIQTL